MVSGRTAVAAFAAVVTVGAAAVAKPGSFDYYYPSAATSVRNSYDEKLCYNEGERAIGAMGYPKVPYMPCCSGKPPLPMDKYADSYDEKEDWGLFCGGTGKVEVKKDHCYKDGERAIGATGKPYVPYMPCCDGREPQSKYGDWGKFCGYAAPKAPKPTVEEKKIPVRCAGEDGYPYVEYVDCGPKYKCAREPKYGWGHFCIPTGDSCYGPGMKAQGAYGYPAITYMPCCDGKKQVEKKGDWGKFCPGKSAPVYEAPKPDYYKPVAAPVDYKPPPPPKGYVPPSYEPSDPVYPTYPYPTKKPKTGGDMTTTMAPISTTMAPTDPDLDANLAVILDGITVCSGNAAPAVADGPFVTEPIAETEVEIELPACESGTLTQSAANALLQAVCDVARTFDPAVQCRIDTVPVAGRMLVSDDDLQVVDRQIFILILIIGWSIPAPLGFAAALFAILGALASIFNTAGPTAEA